MQGKIKFYNGKNGYGFIINNETGKEIFFHATNCSIEEDELQPDTLVEYTVAPGKRGEKAINVTIAN